MVLQVEKFKRGAVPGEPFIGIIMGSWSDWAAGMNMALTTLDELGIPAEAAVISAHRTPNLIQEYASRAIRMDFSAVIAAAGGAAHLPGMVAAHLPSIPVVGVPMKTSTLGGADSLHSIVQMPPEIPVGTMAISGCVNAALYAAQIEGVRNVSVKNALYVRRLGLTDLVMQHPDPSVDPR
ncbi:5-(carboxyamino)imidazole ribonucleotide mutase [bacterium]|nr:5-(carboxyamino)imidazole ribonucleotide mutase [bacterium]